MFEVLGEGVVPVVLGIPNAGTWRLWSASESFTYFIDDAMLTEILAWGRVSRLEVDGHDEREIGFLDRRNCRVQLLPRHEGVFLAEGVPFRGHTVLLSEQVTRIRAGLHDLEAVLASAIFHCGMAGGTFVVSQSGWRIGQPPPSAALARVECAVHRQSEWDEHIALATTPSVGASTLWDARRGTRVGWDGAVVPLHGNGMRQAVEAIVAAVSRWGCAPEDLLLTFREN